MVSKSPKGPAGTVRQSGEPRLKRSSAEMRDATGSNYDRFWQCMFGWQAAERRPESLSRNAFDMSLWGLDGRAAS